MRVGTHDYRITDPVAIDTERGGREKGKVIWCFETVKEMDGQMAGQKKRRRTRAALFVHPKTPLAHTHSLLHLRPGTF